MSRLLALAAFLSPCIALGADVPRPEHPEPMAVREHWSNLNGTWQFRFDPGDEGMKAEWFKPAAAGFDRQIVVPFPWESELSGIKDTSGASKIGWYRRSFRVPATFPKDQHVWLRFGAVDWRADVWLNGRKVAEHDGGYTPFECDVTDIVQRDADNVVVVRAFDPTDPSLPTGKQVGWYTTTSGIWQTVWLEARPQARIAGFNIRTEIDPARATITTSVLAPDTKTYTLAIRSDDPTVETTSGQPKTITSNSGIGASSMTVTLNVREPKPWTPETPHLYEIVLELKDGEAVVDRVKSYFGLRTIARGKLPGEDFERVFLNGKPIYLRGALDQSFNPKGIYTAPTDQFLKDDILLAKRMGTNFLRIHIKPEEPRRLYWADRLGMLVMQDMPNTWEQNERARAAWEPTMRATIARDINHPSIFSWVAFNETWGLGRPERYKADKDTQAWVKRMVAEMRKLDPTRLIEDNSPCNYDHVGGVTDFNSWHFYIDDHASAKKHIEEVVKGSTEGSSFNHCPGETMNSAPLINSEYGAVSAGGGDRDVSWGFRDLTTQLRRHPKIQGYIYTELTDIEWEHNGFADYDRGAKVFGYDAFVPGMTPADLQGADFIGYDAPPAIAAKVGELIRVPLFVSHFSELKDPPTLRWWITGTNGDGAKVNMEPRDRPAEWTAFGVKDLKPIAFKLHEPFVGAMALELLDSAGKRLAANFVNLAVQPESPAPRIERIDEHTVRIRFAPGDYARAKWSLGHARPPGKASGRGVGSFTYRLKLPAVIAKAKPVSFELMVEAAAKGGRDQVDWSQRENGQDYPQTDARTWPSTLDVSVNGTRTNRRSLADDFADARGVLSHLNRVEHGSHGELIRIDAALPESARTAVAADKPVELTMSVPDDVEAKGGLSIFGAETGAFPFDPTLTIKTENDLPEDLGLKADAAVAVDSVVSREQWVLHAGDSNQGKPSEWAYTTTDPGRGWQAPDFDDSGWMRGSAGFGTPDTPALQERTPWNTPGIWLRTSLDLPDIKQGDAFVLRLFHDEDAQVFVNGKRLLGEGGFLTAYKDVHLNAAQTSLFKAGRNIIAVSCRQTGGGQGVDVGLKRTREGGE